MTALEKDQLIRIHGDVSPIDKNSVVGKDTIYHALNDRSKPTSVGSFTKLRTVCVLLVNLIVQTRKGLVNFLVLGIEWYNHPN